MDSNKIDLSVLNRLVEELNAQLKICDALDKKSGQDLIVELSKAMGISTSLALEASAVSGDIVNVIKFNTSPSTSSLDPLTSLFGSKSSKN